MNRRAIVRNLRSSAVAIVGGGIIGLSIAYELAVRRGVPVTVYDTRPPGRGASWAAAGMIAPAFEAAAETGAHPRLFELCLESASLWPEFASRLTAETGLPTGIDAAASLAVALDGAEITRLGGLSDVLSARGVPHVRLTPQALLRGEPALSPDVRLGLELPTDFRVHSREVLAALLSVLRGHQKVRFAAGRAPIKAQGGRIGIDGHFAVVAAAGWETASIKVEERGELYSLVNWDTGLDDIDCHGGQTLSVRAIEGAPKRVVRSGHVYLVPRRGQVVIGATVEPGRAIDAPDAAMIEALRLEAVRLCPGLAEAPVEESWAGIRPGTPDRAPFIGPALAPGLFVAAGHYRNGILLAPITARIIAGQILGDDPGALAAAFSLRRTFAATA